MTGETHQADTASDSSAVPRSTIVTWSPPVLAALLVVAMLRHAARPISDPDAWWHLRVGHLFWSRQFSLTRTGPLSSFASEPWTPRDWIPQLAASLMESWFGLPGVAWLYGASLVGFVVVAYVVCRRTADPLPATLATALCVLGSAGSLSQRPQMVTFILLLVYLGAWLRTASDLRARWWLIPLMWVWASSHGMWYLGVAVGVLLIAGLVMDRRVGLRKAAELALVPLLGLVAAAVTPAGPTLLFAAFQTGDMWKFVTEWGPPDFRSLSPAAAMLMVALVSLLWARMRSSMTWVHLLLLLLATAMVLMAARTVAAGAGILAPLLALSLQRALYGRPTFRVARLEHLSLSASSVLTLVVLALLVPHTSSQPGKVPNDVNDALERVPRGSSIINSYELGGWLHWRHPELNTVIDGFTDGYTVEAVSAFVSAQAVAPGWEEYVDSTGAEIALLPEDSPLAFALTDRLGWTRIESDEGYVLLRDTGR